MLLSLCALHSSVCNMSTPVLSHVIRVTSECVLRSSSQWEALLDWNQCAVAGVVESVGRRNGKERGTLNLLASVRGRQAP